MSTAPRSPTRNALPAPELRRMLTNFENALNAAKPSDCYKTQEAFRQYSLTTESGSVRLGQTCVSCLPNREESGRFSAIVIGKTCVHAASFDLKPDSAPASRYVTPSVMYMDGAGKSHCLGSESLTASMVLDAAMAATNDLLRNVAHQSKVTDAPLQLVMTVDHELIQPRLASGYLLLPESQTTLMDPLAGVDLVNLLNLGFQRSLSLPCEVIACVSSSVALLLVGAHSISWDKPKGMVSAIIGADFSSAAWQNNSIAKGIKQGNIVTCNCEKYDGNLVGPAETNFTTVYGLPFLLGDIDLNEIEGSSRTLCMKSIVGAERLSECCRTLFLRYLKHDAPERLWDTDALSFKGCVEVRNSDSANVPVEFLEQALNWTATAAQAAVFTQIVRDVFKRSATLVGIVLATLAKRTGRLQPALGGLTIILSGVLGRDTSYQRYIREALDTIFTRDTETLVHFMVVEDSDARGAAILGANIAVGRA